MAEPTSLALAQEYLNKAIQLVGLTVVYQLFEKEMNRVISSGVKNISSWF